MTRVYPIDLSTNPSTRIERGERACHRRHGSARAEVVIALRGSGPESDPERKAGTGADWCEATSPPARAGPGGVRHGCVVHAGSAATVWRACATDVVNRTRRLLQSATPTPGTAHISITAWGHREPYYRRSSPPRDRARGHHPLVDPQPPVPPLMETFLGAFSTLRDAAVPFAWQFQPVDTASGGALSDIVAGEPAGDLPDFGGPGSHAKSPVESWLKARGLHKEAGRLGNLPLKLSCQLPRAGPHA